MLENHLKEILLKKDIKQTELEKMTGISRTTINKIANENNEPKIRTALIIAEALNVSVHEIWELKKPTE